MAFEIVLLVAVGVLAAIGKLRQFRTSFVGLFSVATLLFIEVCRVWLPQEKNPFLSTFDSVSAPCCPVASAVGGG